MYFALLIRLSQNERIGSPGLPFSDMNTAFQILRTVLMSTPIQRRFRASPRRKAIRAYKP